MRWSLQPEGVGSVKPEWVSVPMTMLPEAFSGWRAPTLQNATVAAGGFVIGGFSGFASEDSAPARDDGYILSVVVQPSRAVVWKNDREIFKGIAPIAGVQIFRPDEAPRAVKFTSHSVMRAVLPLEFVADQAELAGARGQAVELRCPELAPDLDLLALGQMMLRDGAEAEGALYRESLGAAVVQRLLQRYSTIDRRPNIARGGLAPAQLRTVLEYLEAHLAKDMSLAQLAAVAGLSVAHFCRAFKASTGRSPGTWRAERRTARAKALLADTRLSITEIAAACGFADHSHFGKVFREQVGVAPSVWRRERAS